MFTARSFAGQCWTLLHRHRARGINAKSGVRIDVAAWHCDGWPGHWGIADAHGYCGCAKAFVPKFGLCQPMRKARKGGCGLPFATFMLLGRGSLWTNAIKSYNMPHASILHAKNPSWFTTMLAMLLCSTVLSLQTWWIDRIGTAIARNTPCYNWSICQSCCKRPTCGPKLLHILQLILDQRAITTKVGMTPSHHWAICQDCSKGRCSGHNFFHIPQRILDFRAVPSPGGISPCHHWSFRQNSRKCGFCGHNLLHVSQLISKFEAVTTIMLTATPSNQWPICKDCSKCIISGLNLLHILQLILHCCTVTTSIWIAPCDN